jgi:uncharacterized membrane protein
MHASKLHKYFTSGLLFIIPIWIIVIFIQAFAGLVTSVLEINIILAFLLALVGTTLLGYLVHHVFKRYVVHKLQAGSRQSGAWGFLCRVFAGLDQMGDKAHDAFTHPILYTVDDGIHKLGFITDHDIDILGPVESAEDTAQSDVVRNSVWVYAPQPITMLGELVLVDKHNISTLPPEQRDAIGLFIMTAGLAEQTTNN